MAKHRIRYELPRSQPGRDVRRRPRLVPLGYTQFPGTVTARPYCQEISDLAGVRLVSIQLVVAVAVLAAALFTLAIGMASGTATLGSYRPKVAAWR
jgi:hypothetical protein